MSKEMVDVPYDSGRAFDEGIQIYNALSVNGAAPKIEQRSHLSSARVFRVKKEIYDAAKLYFNNKGFAGLTLGQYLQKLGLK